MDEVELSLDLCVCSPGVFASRELLVPNRHLLLDGASQLREHVLAVFDLLGGQVVAFIDGFLLSLLEQHHLVEDELLVTDHVLEGHPKLGWIVSELCDDRVPNAAEGCDADLVERVGFVDHSVDERVTAPFAIPRNL